MTSPEDEKLARALESLLAAKSREQHRSWIWFGIALGALILALAFHHRIWALLGGIAGALAALQAGVRAHLRADGLRAKAMEKILEEAFRRSGQGSPS